MRSTIIVAGPTRLHFPRSNFRTTLKNSLRQRRPLHQQQHRIVRGVVLGNQQPHPKILTVIQYPASNQVKTTNLLAETSKGNSGLVACYGKDAVAFTFSVDNGRFHSTTIAEDQHAARKTRDTSTHEINDAGSKEATPVTLQLNHWIYDKADSMVRHFLPANHPQSVATGYDQFALASFFASIAGSAGMVLSTQVCCSLHDGTNSKSSTG